MNRFAVALAGVLLLGACSSSPTAEPPKSSDSRLGETEVIHVDVDGRKVTCVVWDGTSAGGVSCNWEPYNRG